MASSCATIFSGTTERIRFESDPPGATITVDGKVYTTPAEVTLSRRKSHEVEFILDDHVPAKRQVLQGTNSLVMGNILFGGIIGLIVDYSSGASNDLEPDVVTIQLVPIPRTPGTPVSADQTPPPTSPTPSASPSGLSTTGTPSSSRLATPTSTPG